MCREYQCQTVIEAVANRDIEMLRRMVEAGNGDWRETDGAGNTVFHLIAAKANKEAWDVLLQGVPEITQKNLLRQLNHEEETPLHVACRQGKTGIVKAFIRLLGRNAKSNLAQLNARGYSPVHEMAAGGHIQLVAILRDAGADFALLTEGGESAAAIAQRGGHETLVEAMKGFTPVSQRSPLSSEGSGGSSGGGRQSVKSRQDVSMDDIAKALNLIISYSELEGEIKKNQVLGKGSFGKVYRGEWHDLDVAIKALHLEEEEMTDEMKEEFENETRVMMKLRHPNVVLLYGICTEPYCMVLELMLKGSLHKVLHGKEVLSWGLRYRFSLDIAKGIDFLHKHEICHRDLKSFNVLVNEHDRAKLADFGLSKIKSTTNQTYGKGEIGTVLWMAPELFTMNSSYTVACDVYSYGIIVWEIMSRKMPYSNVAHPSAIPAIVSRGERERVPVEAPEVLKDLTRACWSQEAEKRPSMQVVLERLKARPILMETVDNEKRESNEELKNEMLSRLPRPLSEIGGYAGSGRGVGSQRGSGIFAAGGSQRGRGMEGYARSRPARGRGMALRGRGGSGIFQPAQPSPANAGGYGQSGGSVRRATISSLPGNSEMQNQPTNP